MKVQWLNPAELDSNNQEQIASWKSIFKVSKVCTRVSIALYQFLFFASFQNEFLF